MKKLYASLMIFLLFFNAEGQNISINDLVGFTSYPVNKFDALISRRGYKPYGYQSDMPAYYKATKDKTLETIIARQEVNDAATVTYQTTSPEEFSGLKNELQKAGYLYTEGKNKKGELVQLYQKGNVTVQPVIKTEEEKKVYCFLVERKALPRVKDIAYVEDLLQLSSHEYLTVVYGEANVKKDLFYFSEQEVNKCSVLFPNTSMQVIFIWDDEDNSRNISFLLIGGHLRTQSYRANNGLVEQNKWRSSQGVFSGMSLKDLVALNGQPITFFGWQSDQPGLVLKKNTGNIDFKKIGIVLNCFDCNKDNYYSKTEILSSTQVLNENHRVYVSTFIVLPEK
ncbi:MAG: hypothetical protein ICV81_10390 [Flavisolibacter sp.]|nr:hypothetical protein [Flavisolibacter sp.]MBD0286552.1 hypothetical protein [Flavisolibacter sp.]MBD0295005.1 hypothetical protein [Flavisolibacter sp.]MBD0365759.1 hypothetical protein [Flavisolibacter sp.]